jgi:hypothetical protein
MRKQRDLRHMLADAETKRDVVGLLAKFFQDSFSDDPIAAREWLEENQTTPDLFVELVLALLLLNEPADVAQAKFDSAFREVLDS